MSKFLAGGGDSFSPLPLKLHERYLNSCEGKEFTRSFAKSCMYIYYSKVKVFLKGTPNY